jgi:hypothetical protein
VDENTADANNIGALASAEYGRADGVQFEAGLRIFRTMELVAGYTFLTDQSDTAFVAPAGGGLIPTPGFTPALPGPFDAAVADLSLDYHLFDIAIARPLMITSQTELRLFAGWRFGWVDQEFDIVYDSIDVDTVSMPVSLSGYGLRTGASWRWHAWRGWSVFGDASGSILISEIESSQVQTQGGVVINSVTQTVTRGVPVIDLSLGLGKNFGPVGVRVGYKMQHWIDALETPDFVGVIPNPKLGERASDLTLSGFFAGVSYAR